MKFWMRVGWVVLLLAPLGGRVEEASPAPRRKSTFRVYDQRPIRVLAPWEYETAATDQPAELLPGANVNGFRSGERQFGGGIMTEVPVMEVPQTNPTSQNVEKQKKSSWFNPFDFLSKLDLIKEEDRKETETSATDNTHKKDEPLEWANLAGKLIQKEMTEEEPSPAKEDERTRSSNPNAVTGGNASATGRTGLQLAPVVAEPTPGVSRNPPRETAYGMPLSPPTTANAVPASPVPVPAAVLPPALRLDPPRAVLPEPRLDASLERSRAAFQESTARWQSSAPSAPSVALTAPPASSRMEPPRFTPASLPPVTPPAFQPAPVSVAPPVVAPPPPPVAEPAPLDRFRGDDYRIRPRFGVFDR